jgi:hypothetical protein
MFAGQVMVGTVVSRTVTVNWQLLVFPAASLAVHVTGLGAMAKVDPEAGLQVTATSPSTISWAD